MQDLTQHLTPQETTMTSATSRTRHLQRAAAALGALLIVGAATTIFAAAPVAAAPADAVPSVRVDYHDLNLATDQGTLELYGRIVSAAHKVCQINDIRDLGLMAAAKACRGQGIAGAVGEVKCPTL